MEAEAEVTPASPESIRPAATAAEFRERPAVTAAEFQARPAASQERRDRARALARTAPPQVATRASYLICATPRTGSYLLCDLLEATGVAGRPTEYLLAGYRKYWTEQWGTSTYREYHERILCAGTTPNGVFGTKVHGAQLLEFLRLATGRARTCMEDRPAVVAAWFPDPIYIWSRRRDAVAQSVSWAKARQTNLWWDTDAPPAPPLGTPMPDALRFDFGFIERSMYSLVEWDGVWRAHFDATGIKPVVVWYEDMLADYRGTVDRVLDVLGVERPGTVGSEPGFRRQADGTSEAWVSRFKRLESAKHESTLAALEGLHSGEVIYVCAGRIASDRIPRDAITIAVDGSWSPAPASYAVLTRRPRSVPIADVVIPIGSVPVEHSFVVRCLLDRRTGEAGVRNRLSVTSDPSPAGIGRSLAAHLGASRIEIVGQ